MDRTQKNCVIDLRVSTKKQGQEGESLETQEIICRNFAGDRNWNVLKVWKTTISGRKEDRTDEIIDFIKSSPEKVDYYLFRSIDRFTRGGSGEYNRLKKALAVEGVQIIDTYGIIQPSINTLAHTGLTYDWSTYFPSEASETMSATNAKQEITTILTRMIGREIELTQQGYRTRRPDDGYVNKKVYVEGKKKTIQEASATRGGFYDAMFELRAQGTLTDPQIVERLNDMGFRSLRTNKWDKEHKNIIGYAGGLPLTIKQLHRIIEKPIYAGVVCEKWTHYKPIKAPYPGIVSINTFNKANRGKIFIKENSDGSLEILNNYRSKTGDKRNKFNPEFPYKFLLCHHCNKPFKASKSKSKLGKKVPYYHCSRGHRYYGIPKYEFEEVVKKYIQNLKFRPEILNALELTFINKYRERERDIVKTSGNIYQNIANLKAEQEAKLQALVISKSELVREKLEQDIEALEVKIKACQKERLKIDITESDIKSFIRFAKQIVEHPAEILLNTANMQAQRSLFGLVFDSMPTFAEIISGTPKLSLIFGLSSEYVSDKSLLVTLPGIEPGF